VNPSALVVGLRTGVKLFDVLACSVFLISIFCPFLQATWYGGVIREYHPGPENFWSFKERQEYSYGGRQFVDEYWFFSYWNRPPITETQELFHLTEPTLILAFVSQILVLLSSVLAIFLDKRWLFLCSIILSAVGLFCMWFFTYALDEDYERFQVAGFWLMLVAALLFVVAFFISGEPRVRTK
jgi:hypothetical protein